MVVRKGLDSSHFNQYKQASYNIMGRDFQLNKEQEK